MGRAVTELHLQLTERVLPKPQLALSISFLCREHMFVGLGAEREGGRRGSQ